MSSRLSLRLRLSYTTSSTATFKWSLPANSSTGARYNVTFDVTNTGQRLGADVAQVYVAEADPKYTPTERAERLSRVDSRPRNQDVSVSLTLAPLPSMTRPQNTGRGCGRYTVEVGRSSEDVPLDADSLFPPPMMLRTTSKRHLWM